MIEYAYSRILVTIASAALVAVVISAGYGASENSSLRCAEQIADGICDAVESASQVDADSYEHRIEIDAASSGDLSIRINCSYIEIQKGMHSITRSFGNSVRLLSGGSQVEFLTIPPGSAVLIKAHRDPLEKTNPVAIELLPP